jgi:hypothetical protein
MDSGRWNRHIRGAAGGCFLVHHVDVTVCEHPVRAIEIIGEPDTVNAELMRVTIDNAAAGDSDSYQGGPDWFGACRRDR